MKSQAEIESAIWHMIKDCGSVEKAQSEVKPWKREGKPAFLIVMTKMYEKPLPDQFEGRILKFFDAVRDAAGATDIDLFSEIADGGCETCDYGSKYGWEFVVWDEAAHA